MPKRPRASEPNEQNSANEKVAAKCGATQLGKGNRLPLEVLAALFRYIDEAEWFRLRLVAKLWKAAVVYLYEDKLPMLLREGSSVLRFRSGTPSFLRQLSLTLGEMSQRVLGCIAEVDASNWYCPDGDILLGILRALNHSPVQVIAIDNFWPRLPENFLIEVSKFAFLRSLDLGDDTMWWEKHHVAELHHLVQLRELRITLLKPTEDQFHQLCAAIPSVEVLQICGCTLSDKCMISLSTTLPLVRSLALGECTAVSDVGYEALGRLTSLTSLRLDGGNDISDESLGSICRSCTKLRSLRILFRYAGMNVPIGLNLTASVIPVIANSLPALEVLQIEPLAVSDVTFQELGKLTNLQVLHINSGAVSDWGLRRLGRLHHLRYLFLRVTEDITSRGLHFLPKNHPRLQTLILSPTATDTCTASLLYLQLINGRVLQNLQHLRHLDLTRCNVDDRVLTSLGRLRHLRLLNLYRCYRITDAGMINLCRPGSQLECLNLDDCRNISDLTLTRLSTHCPHLSDLSLTCCELVSDFGLLALVAIRTMKFINVSGCRLISQQAIIDFIDNLPDLRIASTNYYGADRRVEPHLAEVTSKKPQYEMLASRDHIALLEKEADRSA